MTEDKLYSLFKN